MQTAPTAGTITATPIPATIEATQPPGPRTLPPPRITEGGISGSDPVNMRAIPVSGSADEGVSYYYSASFHCGLNFWVLWDFDGSFWDTVDQSLSDPEAIGLNNYGLDMGTIELISSDAAVYTASNGYAIQLARSSDPERRGMLCV